jgi:hypothetical protein
LREESHEFELATTLIGNLFATVAKFELEQSIVEELYEKIINAVETEHLKLHKVEKSIIYLINHKSANLSSELVSSLLEKVSLISPHSNFPYDLTDLLLRILVHKNPKYKMGNTVTISKLLNEELIEDHNGQWLIPKVYKYLPKIDQKLLKTLIEKSLKNKFDENFFRYAYLNKVTEDEGLIRQFVNIIELYIISTTKRSDEQWLIFTLHEIYRRTSDKEIKAKIESLAEKALFLSFLINIKTFKKHNYITEKWINFLSEDNLKFLSKNKEFKKRLKELIIENPSNAKLVNIYFKYY